MGSEVSQYGKYHIYIYTYKYLYYILDIKDL